MSVYIFENPVGRMTSKMFHLSKYIIYFNAGISWKSGSTVKQIQTNPIQIQNGSFLSLSAHFKNHLKLT